MPDPVSAGRRFVGLVIAHLRERADLSQAELADLLGCSNSFLGHIETGRRALHDSMLEPADKLLKADGLLIGAAELLALDLHTPLHRAHPELDPTASVIHTYATHLVPDILQTPDYTRAILTAHIPALNAAQIQAALDDVSRTRAVLDYVPGPVITAVLDEAVVRRQVGDREVMAGQLDHLIALADRPHLTIQIAALDTPYHPRLTRPTTVVHYPTTAAGDAVKLAHRRLVYIDGWDGTALIRDHQQAAALAEQYGLLQAHALPPGRDADAAEGDRRRDRRRGLKTSCRPFVIARPARAAPRGPPTPDRADRFPPPTPLARRAAPAPGPDASRAGATPPTIQEERPRSRWQVPSPRARPIRCMCSSAASCSTSACIPGTAAA